MKKLFTIAMACSFVCFTLTAQTKAGKIDTMKRKAFTSASSDNRALSKKESFKKNVLKDSANPVRLGSSQRPAATVSGKERLQKRGW